MGEVMYSPFDDAGPGPPKSQSQQGAPPQPPQGMPTYPPTNFGPVYYYPPQYHTPQIYPPYTPYPNTVPYQPPPPSIPRPSAPPPSQPPPPQTQPQQQPQPPSQSQVPQPGKPQSVDELIAKLTQESKQAKQQAFRNQFIPLNPSPAVIANPGNPGNPGINDKKRKQFCFEYEGDIGQQNKRRKRFDSVEDLPAMPYVNQQANIPLSKDPIIGTCMNLEKDYYRLTSDIDPATVRPEYILKKSLKHLQELWKQRKMDYLTICNQMKSIRQDLTVQHIKNSFSVQVYEAHARIALENGDFQEFNQCQTQLASLYELNPYQDNEMEFTAYRLLYNLKDGTSRHTTLIRDIQELTNEQRKNSTVVHAVETCAAYYSNNFYKFFKLYFKAPNMGKQVLDLHLDWIRNTILKMIKRSYPTPVETHWLSKTLGFTEVSECKEFLGSGAHFITNNSNTELLDIKRSTF